MATVLTFGYSNSIEEGHIVQGKNMSCQWEGETVRVFKNNPILIRAHHRRMSLEMDGIRQSLPKKRLSYVFGECGESLRRFLG